MREKYKSSYPSPDLSKLQEVVIDDKTKIYIPLGADSQEAKEHYLSKLREKEKRNL